MSDVNQNQITTTNTENEILNTAPVNMTNGESISNVNDDMKNNTKDLELAPKDNSLESGNNDNIEINVLSDNTGLAECCVEQKGENNDTNVTDVGACSKIDADTPIQQIKEIEKDFKPDAKLDNPSENVNKLLPEEESVSNSQDEWVKRESALLEKISMLEKMQVDNSNQGLQLQLQVKCEENEILRAKVINLETELNAVLKKPNAKNKDIVSKIKKQHDELLTKARGMIFDKTKMIKNQELQIEALTSQVTSLKDVVSITKDLLSIRNLEVTHLQEKLQVMDMKIQAEKERYNLMAKKIESGTKLNEELKNEYTTQLAIFKDLKARYEEKFKVLEEDRNQPSSSNEQQ